MHNPLRILIATACTGVALSCLPGAFAQMNTPSLSPTVVPDMTPNAGSDKSDATMGGGRTPATSRNMDTTMTSTGTNTAANTSGNTGYGTNPAFVLSSKIMGAQVKNEQDESLGTISNLVVNPDTGHIRYAVISTGGKKVTVPWNALKPAPHAATGGAPHFTLDTTKDKLANAPKFDSNNLSSLSNRTKEEPIFTYYELVWFPDVLTSEEEKSQKGGTMGKTSPAPSMTPAIGATTTPMMSPSPSP